MFVGTRTPQAEVALPGGDMTEGVVRVGDTVRRPVGRYGTAVHALLRHLAAVGFDRAPRLLGVDERGREILTFLPGQVPTRPLPGYAVTDGTLAGLAELLRGYHDAVAGFVPPDGAKWAPGATDDAEPELVGHCDLTPENVVFRDGRPWGLIDFDLARPTTRLFDAAVALRHWAPIADPVDRDPRQLDLDVGARLRLFCDAYGFAAADRRRLLEVSRLRFGRSYQAMRASAEAEGGPWARMWAAGAGERIRRAAAWLDANCDDLARHLL
ncbi:trifolitoxin immunity protein [Sphaerisporangium rufum]|uniref:Trifolitoxin immunity protein n=1 Tax=Sphaerisporangium rufum TaxID=1381558 RepID=A0A919R861_9ACTN|nr:phosphotransferase [Sphaerisporangium rufum]GII79070.1 trifolitoxin immunity protein [Sphaerisporangium rufum]